ncbi:hypothetical protein T484DRAFT_1850114 [Baffinella frigidus]|nr:hypothetical protein T484DRAFT_1850114 [Cryptophyta sp. CCMP2293]
MEVDPYRTKSDDEGAMVAKPPAKVAKSRASDAEYAWTVELKLFLAVTRQPEKKCSLGKREVNRFALYQAVAGRGGLSKVVFDRKMSLVASSLGFSQFGQRLKHYYEKSLHSFESFKLQGVSVLGPEGAGRSKYQAASFEDIIPISVVLETMSSALATPLHSSNGVDYAALNVAVNFARRRAMELTADTLSATAAALAPAVPAPQDEPLFYPETLSVDATLAAIWVGPAAAALPPAVPAPQDKPLTKTNNKAKTKTNNKAKTKTNNKAKTKTNNKAKTKNKTNNKTKNTTNNMVAPVHQVHGHNGNWLAAGFAASCP